MKLRVSGLSTIVKRFKSWGVLAVVAVVYLAWLVGTNVLASPGTGLSEKALITPLTGLDEKVAKPFAGSKKKLDEVEDGDYLEGGHPLKAVMRTFSLLYHGGDSGNPNKFERDGYLRRARSIIDYLLVEWEPAQRGGGGVRLGYGFEYRGNAPGWWSGMVDAQFALILEVAAEYFGDEDYRTAMKASLHRVLKSPGEGGITWSGESGCWFSEYAWPNIKQDEEYYVLNGHLYALQALLMLYDLYPDPSLEKALDCAQRGTIAKGEEFFPGDGKWPLYMLDEPTINMVHYVIFEASQFDALAALTGNPEYTKQADRRRSVLAEQYPVVWWRDDGGRIRLLFSLLGAPNPYGADTFAVEITCSLADGSPVVFSERRPLDKTVPFGERSFAVAMADTLPDKCSVVSHDEGDTMLMHASQPVELRSGSLRAEKVKSVVPCCDVRFDEAEEGLVIDPAVSARPDTPGHYLNNQGRVSWDFSAKRGEVWVIGVEVFPGENIKAGVMFSCNGTTSFRYAPKLTGGKENLILLHWLGFPKSDDLVCIDRVTFFVFTSGVETEEPISLRIGRTLAFANRRQLQEFLLEHPQLVVNADGAQL